VAISPSPDRQTPCPSANNGLNGVNCASNSTLNAHFTQKRTRTTPAQWRSSLRVSESPALVPVSEVDGAIAADVAFNLQHTS
jgi:hypothetical protein